MARIRCTISLKAKHATTTLENNRILHKMSTTYKEMLHSSFKLLLHIKWHKFCQKPLQSYGLGQIVALVIVNKHMKFHKICFNTFKVIAKVKVCHNDDNNYAGGGDDTSVMTIPKFFFFEKQPS